MSNPSQTFPNLRSLYWRDFTIQRAIKACCAGLILALGGLWMSHTLSPLPSVERDFDAACAFYATVGGVVFTALAAMVLAWRYFRLRKILLHGEIIEATVEQLESRYTENHSDSSPIGKRSYSYHYYATLSYHFAGAPRKARLKLPNAGSTYRLVKGGKTELSVLPTNPDKPLVRVVYLGRF